MDREVKGKVAAITGAANGLGLVMATSFLEQGVKLVILLDLDEENGKESVAKLKQKHGNDRAVFYKCNVCSDLDDTYNTIVNNHKSVDILINNAGVLDETSIKRTMDVNSVAVMEWTVKFYEHMRIDKGGRGGTIINVSSVCGYRISPYIPYYQGSKFAVIGFSKSIGHEVNFKKSGVRVLTLCPGLTHTNLANYPNAWDGRLEEFLAYMETHYEWQDSSAVGIGIVDIFRQGATGTVWVVEGSRPAEMLNL